MTSVAHTLSDEDIENLSQYIAVAAGGNNQIDAKRGNSVFVFAVQ